MAFSDQIIWSHSDPGGSSLHNVYIWVFCCISFVFVVELEGWKPQLRGHRRCDGGVFPEPEDCPALWPHQLCSRHQSGGSVSAANAANATLTPHIVSQAPEPEIFSNSSSDGFNPGLSQIQRCTLSFCVVFFVFLLWVIDELLVDQQLLGRFVNNPWKKNWKKFKLFFLMWEILPVVQILLTLEAVKLILEAFLLMISTASQHE